jgi:hypothetical protein
VITMRRLLPAFVNSPRRLAVSTVLVAGVAAGPLAGNASTDQSPIANPVVAAITGTRPEVSSQQWGPAVPPADTGGAVEAALAPGAPADQSHIVLSGDQLDNARAIIHATKQMNLPPRAAVIAVATSLQESKLQNLGDLGANNDHDSLGLFQQRPSSGWGSPAQVTNPNYATKAFLRGLQQVPGWESMPLTEAAQTVQVSAFGGAYAQWEKQAADIVASNSDA